MSIKNVSNNYSFNIDRELDEDVTITFLLKVEF